MASRVGTYLSDESIRKMCPLDHMPPGSKTYELFKIASDPGKLAQRPLDPKSALLALSKLQNQSYQDLEKRYIQSLSVINRNLSALYLVLLDLIKRHLYNRQLVLQH